MHLMTQVVVEDGRYGGAGEGGGGADSGGGGGGRAP